MSKDTIAKPKSVRLTITTTTQVHDLLKRLVELGLYGTSVSEVAEQLMREQLKADLRRKRTALLEQEEEKK